MIDNDGTSILEGQFVNGLLSGYGRQINKFGEYYIGDYKDWRQHGQGTLVYSNGKTYVGAWKDHTRHGQGKETEADGTVKEGIWVYDYFEQNI